MWYFWHVETHLVLDDQDPVLVKAICDLLGLCDQLRFIIFLRRGEKIQVDDRQKVKRGCDLDGWLSGDFDWVRDGFHCKGELTVKKLKAML